MSNWPVHARWKGPIVIVGFGSIGRGTLPLILRHIACDRSQITIIDPSDRNKPIADAEGLRFIQQPVTPKTYKKVLKPLLSGPEPGFIVNLSVDVSSVEMMAFARTMKALYIDTVIEPWEGFYFDGKKDNAQRTNYALRQTMLALKQKLGPGPTAVSCCGANPGMVSWFVKQALMNLAAELALDVKMPTTRDGWARLMKRLGVKGIHVAERDTQRAKTPKPLGTFINTWSVDGFISEGLQPAELGWGTHEKKLPPEGRRFTTGSKCAIFLERPGANTRVRSWVPGVGPQFAFLVTHNEAISIADYYTVWKGKTPHYRPTCHYAYHPCGDAVLSLHEMFGAAGVAQATKHILGPDEIVDGEDILGVLLYGHRRNAYWFGSHLSNAEARELAPHQNATGLQVTSAVLAGMVWAMENPNAGIVETDEMDHLRCLRVQSDYLGEIKGVYTDWTPLDNRGQLFAEKLDRRDPWQFSNILVP